MPSDHQKWGKSGELCRGDGTAGDNRRREKGLEKFLVRSYSLKGRNTVVALGVIVPLILQNMFVESSSAFHLLVLLQHYPF